MTTMPLTPVSVTSNYLVRLWPTATYWVIGELDREPSPTITLRFHGVKNAGDAPVLVEHTGPYTVEHVQHKLLVKYAVPKTNLAAQSVGVSSN